jgi:malate dehydrogenase
MNKKVSIIGAGHVGASLAQLVAHAGLSDVVLFDVVEGMPQGKALDLSHACPLWGSAVSIAGTNDYDDTAGSDVLVITAGLPRKPGMSRDDLLQANAEIIRTVTAETSERSPNAIIIMVTNPMDVMAHVAMNVSGFAPERVMGMGGVLDSARLRTFIAWELGISPGDVEALVLGGHGDQMVPIPRFTTAKGVPITEILSGERIDAIVERTKNGGAEVVALLKTGSAYYAPAASCFEMLKAVLFDQKRMLPCSVYLSGEYGIKDTYAGVPTVLGRGGVERIIELELDPGEMERLHGSARAVRALTEKLNID